MLCLPQTLKAQSLAQGSDVLLILGNQDQEGDFCPVIGLQQLCRPGAHRRSCDTGGQRLFLVQRST